MMSDLTPIAGLLSQSASSALELEHALIMLLLLVGLLSIHGGQRRYVPWVVSAGIVLALLTPVHELEPAWPFISALVVPPLLWQVGVRLALARSTFVWRGWLVWLLTALLITLTLNVGGRVSPAQSALLGILAVSLIWQVRERATGSTDLGAFGQLALAFLLAEVDLTRTPLGPFLGAMVSGVGGGIVLGYIGVRVAFRLPVGDARNLFSLGLAYLAYLAGALIGASGVVTAAMTGLMVAVYGYNVGLWPTTAMLPAPLDQRGVFVLLVAIWLLLGWQAHVPLTANHLIGIALALVAATVGLLVGRRLVPWQTRAAQSLLQALWHKERKVFLLLAGTLLLWSPKATLEPWFLVVALLAASLSVLLLRLLLYPIFDLLEIELRLPDEGQTE